MYQHKCFVKLTCRPTITNSFSAGHSSRAGDCSQRSPELIVGSRGRRIADTPRRSMPGRLAVTWH